MTTTTVRRERTPQQQVVDRIVLERVQRGMQLLEEEYGPDWVEHIDLARLNLRLGACCVLGQLYDVEGRRSGEDGYNYGCRTLLGNSDTNARDHGFLAEPDFIDAGTSWDELQAAWEYVLTPRVQERA